MKLPGCRQLPVRLPQAREHLAVATGLLRAVFHGVYGLPVQHQPPLLERAVDARHPAHLAHPARQLLVRGTVELHAVAPCLLGRVAGGVGCAERLRQRLERGWNHRYADAGAEAERVPFPGEPVSAQGLQQLARDAHGDGLGTVLDQQPELVAAQPGERVLAPEMSLQQIGNLPQQIIAGSMPAGVVDDLELIEVDIAQCVLGGIDTGALQRLFHP